MGRDRDTAALLRSGSWRPKSRHADRAHELPSVFERGVPPKPTGLGARESEIWDRLIPAIADRLYLVDCFALEIGVFWLAESERIHRALDKAKLLSPEWSRLTKAAAICAKHVLSFSKKFGLSPRDSQNLLMGL